VQNASVLATLQVAWEFVLNEIEFHIKEDRSNNLPRIRRSYVIDLIAVSIGINLKTFRNYVDNQEFVKSFLRNPHQSKTSENVAKIVSYYWRRKSENLNSDFISTLISGAMGNSSSASNNFESYIGEFVFIHLKRDGNLYSGPFTVVRIKNDVTVFSTKSEFVVQGNNASVELNYDGVVIPYNEGLIFLSVGVNRVARYFRSMITNSVHDVSSLVTFGIYSGRTTFDDVIFSARAALILKMNWDKVKNNTDFKNDLAKNLRNNNRDLSGAIVVPRELKMIQPS
jgi:hypothetical protein